MTTPISEQLRALYGTHPIPIRAATIIDELHEALTKLMADTAIDDESRGAHILARTALNMAREETA